MFGEREGEADRERQMVRFRWEERPEGGGLGEIGSMKATSKLVPNVQMCDPKPPNHHPPR